MISRDSTTPAMRNSVYPTRMMYSFGPFELDHDAYVLRRADTVIHLRPKLLDVLVHLIEHRERVVSHDELLEHCWGSEVPSKSSVHWAVSKIRTALDPGTDAAGFIETVPRRGYRFIGQLRETTATPVPPKIGPTPVVARPNAPGSVKQPDGTRPQVQEDWEAFIGRESILAELEAGWTRACHGRGGLFMLIGEPGIGKSRCLLEFARQLRSASSIWMGLCGDNASTPPLLPWIQILRACTEEAPARSYLQEEGEGVLAALERGPLQRESGAFSARSVVLLDRVRTLLLIASKDAPRVLLLDDLSDADEASLDLLLLLSQQLSVSSLLIVATLRRTNLDPRDGGDQRLRRICNGARCIDVPPWSREEVGEFVRRCSPDGADERRTTYLWQQSGGNPLYLQELVRLQMMHGAAPTSPSDLQSVVGRRVIPDTVQEVVRFRIKDLPRDTREVLEVASVIGRCFEIALIARVHKTSGQELLAALDVAQRAGVIEPSNGTTRFVFRHDLIRDAIYAELSGAQRAHLHGRIGEALEDAAFAPLVPSVLAWHFYCSAPVDHASKAIDYALRAAREARRVGAHGDAVRFCEWAQESQAFCSELPTERRCELRIELGAALIAFGEPAQGRRHLIRAIEIAEAQRLPSILARAGLQLRHSILLSAAPDPIALRVLEEARRELPEDEVALRSRVSSHLACMPPHLHRPEGSRALLDEAFALARSSNSRESWIDAQRAACQLRTGPDHAHALLESAAELERSGEQLGDRRAAVEGQVYRYLALIQLGRLPEASEIVGALSNGSPEAARGQLGGLVQHLSARTEYLAGRLDAAAERYEALRARRRRVRSDLGEFHWLAGMTLIHLEKGTSADMWPKFMERTVLWRGRSQALAALALRLLVSAGRVSEARETLESMPTNFVRKDPLLPGQLGVFAHLALVAAALGENAWCKVLYDQLSSRRALHAVDLLWFSLGSVEYFLGVLALALGDLRESRHHFEAAIASNDAAGHVPQSAWSRFQLARVLARQASPRSGTEADPLLDEAADFADSLQLSALRRAIQAERAGTPSA